MSQILRLPTLRSLTRTIAHLSPAKRLETRRRIEAIAYHWTLYLVNKYGETYAVGVCRDKMIYCATHAQGLRSHIWSRVYNNLRPQHLRPGDKWYRG